MISEHERRQLDAIERVLRTGKAPRFVKRYADLAGILGDATRRFSDDVRNGEFPAAEHTFVASVDFAAEDGPAQVTVGLVVGAESALLIDTETGRPTTPPDALFAHIGAR